MTEGQNPANSGHLPSMKKPAQYNDLAAYFRWQEKWGPRLQTLATVAFFAAGLVPLFVGLNGLVTGVVPTMAKHNSNLVRSFEEPMLYWFFVCLWLGVAILFWAFAMRSVIWVKRQNKRFWVTGRFGPKAVAQLF
jgi:hypothetical protein